MLIIPNYANVCAHTYLKTIDLEMHYSLTRNGIHYFDYGMVGIFAHYFKHRTGKSRFILFLQCSHEPSVVP